MRVAIVALGVLLCSTATAGPFPWMKNKHPDTLIAIILVDKFCPVSEAEITEVVNGVLIRWRLRPGKLPMSDGEIAFQVKINCFADEPVFVYSLDINFFTNPPDRALIDVYPNYGALGFGEREKIIKRIRNGVEDLVADYLQANFDLAPE